MIPLGTKVAIDAVPLNCGMTIYGPDGNLMRVESVLSSAAMIAHDRVSRIVSNGTRTIGIAKPGDFVLHQPYAVIEIAGMDHRLLEEAEIDIVFALDEKEPEHGR